MTRINRRSLCNETLFLLPEIHLKLLIVLEVHKVTSRPVVLILFHGEV